MNAYFVSQTRDGIEFLHPQPFAGSGWGDGQLRGYAISGAMARAAEHCLADRGIEGLRLTRWTADLMRPVQMAPVVASAGIARAGRRLALVTTELLQHGSAVARGSALFLRPGGSNRGAVWSAGEAPVSPPAGMVPLPPENRLYASGGTWSVTPDDHQDAQRKMTWHLPHDIVEGEAASPLQVAAATADGANMVMNWGTAGLEFINADMTLQLSRLPEPGGIGLMSLSRSEHDGLAVGTAVLFDARGVLGTSAVSAIANGEATVDPRRFLDPRRSMPGAPQS